MAHLHIPADYLEGGEATLRLVYKEDVALMAAIQHALACEEAAPRLALHRKRLQDIQEALRKGHTNSARRNGL